MALPALQTLWDAINAYLKLAYDGPPPSAIRARLDTLKALAPEDFWQSTIFEHASDGHRLALRLGNRVYPHMKLVIERRPDRKGYLFRADTHDTHCCPVPGAREHNAFRQLMEMNQTIAQSIEAAWADANLPTFKTFLREDLERRRMKVEGLASKDEG